MVNAALGNTPFAVTASPALIFAYDFCAVGIDCFTKAPASKETPDFKTLSCFMLLLWLLRMLLGSDIGDICLLDAFCVLSMLSNFSTYKSRESQFWLSGGYKNWSMLHIFY